MVDGILFYLFDEIDSLWLLELFIVADFNTKDMLTGIGHLVIMIVIDCE